VEGCDTIIGDGIGMRFKGDEGVEEEGDFCAENIL